MFAPSNTGYAVGADGHGLEDGARAVELQETAGEVVRYPDARAVVEGACEPTRPGRDGRDGPGNRGAGTAIETEPAPFAVQTRAPSNVIPWENLARGRRAT